MNETNGSGRRLVVYAIPEAKDGEKAYWPKLGVAYTNRDGSITIVLDGLPINTNRLQVREPRPPAEGRGPAEPRAAGGGRREFDTVEVRP